MSPIAQPPRARTHTHLRLRSNGARRDWFVPPFGRLEMTSKITQRAVGTRMNGPGPSITYRRGGSLLHLPRCLRSGVASILSAVRIAGFRFFFFFSFILFLRARGKKLDWILGTRATLPVSASSPSAFVRLCLSRGCFRRVCHCMGDSVRHCYKDVSQRRLTILFGEVVQITNKRV